MEISAEGMEPVAHVVWRQVEDVHFALIGMNTGTETEASPHEVVGECEISSRACRDRLQERPQARGAEPRTPGP